MTIKRKMISEEGFRKWSKDSGGVDISFLNYQIDKYSDIFGKEIEVNSDTIRGELSYWYTDSNGINMYLSSGWLSSPEESEKEVLFEGIYKYDTTKACLLWKTKEDWTIEDCVRNIILYKGLYSGKYFITYTKNDGWSDRAIKSLTLEEAIALVRIHEPENEMINIFGDIFKSA